MSFNLNSLYLKFLMLLLYLNFITACHPKPPWPDGDVLQGDRTGYWKITKYESHGHALPLSQIPEKYYLEINGGTMETDSSLILLYSKGSQFRTFAFYNESVTLTSLMKGVMGGYDYNKEAQQNIFWYRINEETGFLAIVHTDVETGVIQKIGLSGVITSPTYKPELDSLRFTYEPTVKFR